MRRILTIAGREYRAMVATKAFLFTMALMPLLMIGGALVPAVMSKLESSEPRKLMVIDQTGQLFDALSDLADERNQELRDTPEEEKTSEEKLEEAFEKERIYHLERFESATLTDEERLALSDSVRDGELYAFVEIPAGATAETQAGVPEIVFYSKDGALSDMRGWLERSINSVVRAQRLKELNVSPVDVHQALTPVSMSVVGLLERSETGEILPAEETDMAATIFLPMGVMMMMFMVIFMAAQPMLEAVLEEKSDRIAEVLLGAVSARQLLVGKLLGNVAGSLTVFAMYAAGLWGLAWYRGWLDKVPFELVPMFVVYQILGVLFFSSIFIAIGAAVKQLKEAQSLLLPVWMVMLCPMFVWFNVVREPNSTIALTLSFFPPSTPLMMVLRLATGADVPLWQIAASILVMLLGTFLVVTAAARIFQIGILWQGRSPSLGEVIRWLMNNPNTGA